MGIILCSGIGSILFQNRLKPSENHPKRFLSGSMILKTGAKGKKPGLKFRATAFKYSEQRRSDRKRRGGRVRSAGKGYTVTLIRGRGVV
jgi:hypothetical protein